MGGMLWWLIVLIGLLLAGFVAAVRVKKYMSKPEDMSGPGFTLSDLRTLHRSGKMTDSEFERAKEVVLAAAKHAAEKQAQEAKAETARANRRPPLPPQGNHPG